MKQPGIYGIIHKESGKVYIGQTADLRNRLSRHKSWFANPTRKINRHLHNYATKYPITDFEFSTIQVCSKEELDAKEMFWYEVFKHRTFNSRPNPVTNRGCKRTEEFCVENRRMLKEYYSVTENVQKQSDKIRAAMANPEIRLKISAAARNRKPRIKTAEQLESQKGNAQTTNFLRGNSKCLAQYTKDGVLVDFFINSFEAAKSIGKSQGNITSALTGKLKSAYGFKWKYISNEEYLKLNNGNILKSNFKIQNPHPIAV